MKTNIFYKLIKLKILETAINILFDRIVINFRDPGKKISPANLYLGQKLITIRETTGMYIFKDCRIHTIYTEYDKSKDKYPLYSISFSYSTSNIGGDFDEFSRCQDTILVDRNPPNWEFIE